MLTSTEHVQTKVNMISRDTSYSKGNSMDGISLYVNFLPGLKHFHSTRSYYTFIDALSYFGGLVDFIVIGMAFLYGYYSDARFKNDMIHKGCMITGKFGLKASSTEYQHKVYHKKGTVLPEIDFFESIKKCFVSCCNSLLCKKKKHNGASKESCEADDSEAGLLTEVFDNVLDRQTDMKHILQLFQDVELIKKVLFEQRHIVLSPLVTIECEKRHLNLEKDYSKEKVDKNDEHEIKNELLGDTKQKNFELNGDSKYPNLLLEIDDVKSPRKISSTKNKKSDNKKTTAFLIGEDGKIKEDSQQKTVYELQETQIIEIKKRESLENKFDLLQKRMKIIENDKNIIHKPDSLGPIKRKNFIKNNLENQSNNNQVKKEIIIDQYKNEQSTQDTVKLTQEYLSDVYQALERGQLFDNMYFKRIFVNSIKELKNKPDYQKTQYELKLDKIFLEYLPKSILNCEYILEDNNNLPDIPDVKEATNKEKDVISKIKTVRKGNLDDSYSQNLNEGVYFLNDTNTYLAKKQ